MKFCSNCGAEMADNQMHCTHCDQANPAQESTANQTNNGYTQPSYNQANNYSQENGYYMNYPQAQPTPRSESGLVTATKVLMVIGCITTTCYGFFVPALWCVPMTISYFKKIKRGEPISTAFKVCSLLFVSLIGGILMLVDNEH